MYCHYVIMGIVGFQVVNPCKLCFNHYSPLTKTHLSLAPCIVDIRETAFVYAITAAGVTHAVTQACSMGDLLQCGCEATRNRAPPRPPLSTSGDGVKWEWGGCGDDVEFGYEKSKQFMDAKRRRGKSDIRTLIDLHNNEAGRLVRKRFSECLCGLCL